MTLMIGSSLQRRAFCTCFQDGGPKLYGYFTWADFKSNSMHSAACYYIKRSRRIFEKANEYYEDAFHLNVGKKSF